MVHQLLVGHAAEHHVSKGLGRASDVPPSLDESRRPARVETAREAEDRARDRGHTVPGDDDGVGGDGGRAYQREKKRGRGGFDDRVAKMTRDDPPARAKAKAAAEDAKTRERTRSGRVADVHTNITSERS